MAAIHTSITLQGAELRYFEALMLQSEKWGWPQAASRFAQAALRQLEVVYADSNAPLLDQDTASRTTERREKGSKLCTNLFVYALEAGHYEVSVPEHSLHMQQWPLSNNAATSGVPAVVVS